MNPQTGPVHRGVHLAVHLARRFTGMLSHRPVAGDDLLWVDGVLTEDEAALWHRMLPADQRHSVSVARRFLSISSAGLGESAHPARDDLAAALLHDVGKMQSELGVWSRVVATVVGPRTARFRRYHDHERLGAEMLRACGSSEHTAALVDGSSPDRRAVEALRRADDI